MMRSPREIYVLPSVLEKLRTLRDRTRVPIAEFVREGIDLVLAKHGGENGSVSGMGAFSSTRCDVCGHRICRGSDDL